MSVIIGQCHGTTRANLGKNPELQGLQEQKPHKSTVFGTVRSGLFRHFNVGNLDSACAANHSDVAHARAVDIESETLPAGLSRMDIDELSASAGELPVPGSAQSRLCGFPICPIMRICRLRCRVRGSGQRLKKYAQR